MKKWQKKEKTLAVSLYTAGIKTENGDLESPSTPLKLFSKKDIRLMTNGTLARMNISAPADTGVHVLTFNIEAEYIHNSILLSTSDVSFFFFWQFIWFRLSISDILISRAHIQSIFNRVLTGEKNILISMFKLLLSITVWSTLTFLIIYSEHLRLITL